MPDNRSCSYCEQSFSTSQARASHERQVHGRVFKGKQKVVADHRSRPSDRSRRTDPSSEKRRRCYVVLLPDGRSEEELKEAALKRAAWWGTSPKISSLVVCRVGDYYASWDVAVAHVDVTVNRRGPSMTASDWMPSLAGAHS